MLRGLRTLPVRLERGAGATPRCWPSGWQPTRGSDGSATPGCQHDPGHEVAAARWPASDRCSPIELADAATADAFIDAARLWAHATSLGGVESIFERRRRWPGELPTVPEGLVRLSVGIEHVEDLWDDLAQALPDG